MVGNVVGIVQKPLDVGVLAISDGMVVSVEVSVKPDNRAIGRYDVHGVFYCYLPEH
ncbi:unnamed protein product [Ectocarpus sp. CCAP 1310/34]|nr:unnamed protein product [Ectocarpus sp. CCAP 1310/34]